MLGNQASDIAALKMGGAYLRLDARQCPLLPTVYPGDAAQRRAGAA
jgi:hypothetical protein